MNWLFNVIDAKAPRLKEPLVDCTGCQLQSPLRRTGKYRADRKCCEFSPFWSSFAIGGWLAAGNSLDSLQALKTGEMILTQIGILHSVEHRLGQENLCHHFSKKSNNCSIWSDRPPTCYTFFCASEYKNGISEYSNLEDWLLSIESAAIQAYFKKKGISMAVWDKWAEYMEPVPDPETFPSELLIDNYATAEKLFLDCYSWLKESGDCALLRMQVKASWEQKFAKHPQFINLN